MDLWCSGNWDPIRLFSPKLAGTTRKPPILAVVCGSFKLIETQGEREETNKFAYSIKQASQRNLPTNPPTYQPTSYPTTQRHSPTNGWVPEANLSTFGLVLIPNCIKCSPLFEENNSIYNDNREVLYYLSGLEEGRTLGKLCRLCSEMDMKLELLFCR